LFGEFLARPQQLADLLEAFQKNFTDLLVSLGEFRGDFVEERADLIFRQRPDSGDDPANPLRITETEWPQENA
jgi:hypothetical protein